VSGTRKKPREYAWDPAEWTAEEAIAVQAVAKGIASEREQTRAMRWIIHQCCKFGELSFRSDSDGGERETSFAQGKWFVGQQIMKMVDMPPAVIAQMQKGNK